MQAFGFNAFPSAALVAPDGSVLYAGSPSGVTAQLIEQHLDKVRLMPELPESLSDVTKEYEDDDYENAIKKLERHLGKDQLDEAERTAAKDYLEALIASGRDAVETARKQLAGGDPYAAWLRLEQLVERFGRHAVGQEAAELQESIEDDKAHDDELSAGKKWDKLREKLADLSDNKAEKALESFVRKYGETKAGEAAQKRLAALKRQ